MARCFSALVAALFLCSLAEFAAAAKVKVWQQASAKDFDKAKFQQAILSSDGTIQLSRLVKPLSDVKAAHVWDLAEDAKANLYAATGDEGKLYKIAPDGKTLIAYTASESQVLSLASGPDGSIYAGTGPSGKIVKLSPDGSARVLADNLDSY